MIPSCFLVFSSRVFSSFNAEDHRITRRQCLQSLPDDEQEGHHEQKYVSDDNNYISTITIEKRAKNEVNKMKYDERYEENDINRCISSRPIILTHSPLPRFHHSSKNKFHRIHRSTIMKFNVILRENKESELISFYIARWIDLRTA
jgi:hypothetical protein